MAMFFIAVGVYSTNNNLNEVWEVLFFGVLGAVLMALDFPVAPILLGYVLGPLLEQNFRSALQISRGDMSVFITSPISAGFLFVCFLLIAGQVFLKIRAVSRNKKLAAT